MPWFGFVGSALLLFMFGLMILQDQLDARWATPITILKLACASAGGVMFGASLATML